jgi:hypothetical protein
MLVLGFRSGSENFFVFVRLVRRHQKTRLNHFCLIAGLLRDGAGRAERNGALTQPGGAAQKVSYADI